MMLNINYAAWKEDALEKGWQTYHIEVGATSMQVITGTPEFQLQALASGVNFPDWQTNFPGSIEVNAEDEAIHLIVKNFLPTGGSPRDPTTGAMLTAAMEYGQPASLIPRIENWEEEHKDISDVEFNTLWEKEGSGTFWSAVFQLSSNEFYFRVVVDDETLFINDLGSQFHGLVDDEEIRSEWELAEYDSNKWKYKPYVPIKFKENIKLQFQTTCQDPQIVLRGMSSCAPA